MSQQTADTSDAYTIVVFRGSSSKPLRFSFPRKFMRKLLILAAILIVADLLVDFALCDSNGRGVAVVGFSGGGHGRT